MKETSSDISNTKYVVPKIKKTENLATTLAINVVYMLFMWRCWADSR